MVAPLDLLFPLAIAALLLIAAIAATNRIFAAMAWRNALRRPRQSLMIVAGLLVGTAIVSGALVSGDSMEYAIIEATLDAFQEIDETMSIDGFNFFPQALADVLPEDARLAEVTDAIGVNILWDAAVTDERTQLYEPSMRLVGFDPQEDATFGPFVNDGDAFTGQDLRPDEVVLGKEAALALRAAVGDTLTLNYTRPVDPLLPTFHGYEGQTNASAGGGLPSPLPAYAEPLPWEKRIPVAKGSVRLGAILSWNPVESGAPQDLDVELLSPAGRSYRNENGTLQAPDVPATLNVTASLAEPLEPGEWTLRVHAKAAANARFNGTVVELTPVYDLAEFERRVQALRTQFPDYDPSELPEPPRLSTPMRVAFIAASGKGPHFKLPTEQNVFLRLDEIQRLLARPGEINMIKLSNHGGVEDGPETAPLVVQRAWDALNATKPRFPDHPAVQSVKVDNAKAFWLEQARQLGQIFSIFLTFIGSFSVIAGLMLIINIFTMLAEERKAELGIGRAVGLRRDHLARLFALEGSLYAIPAAVLGTFAGLGLAAILIWGFNAFDSGGTFPPIPYRVEPASLLLAFATGILLTFATVYVGARRVSRLNIVRAIRNLEEPEKIRGGRSLAATLLLVGSGLAGTLAGFVVPSFAWQVVGPTLLTLGSAYLLRRFFPRRLVYPFSALLLFAYLAVNLFTTKRYETIEGNVFGPVRGVLLALCVVIIVVYNETVARSLGRALRRIRPFRAVGAIAVSYPLHKKFRTGMTLAMFSVILLMVSLFTIFGALFAPDPEKEAGGYDIEATTSLPVAGLEAYGDEPRILQGTAYDVVPYFLQIGGDLVKVDNATTGQAGPPLDYIYGISEPFADRNQFRLVRRDPAYATDADAYRDVTRRSDIAIVAYMYSTDEDGNEGRHGIGSIVQVDARGGERAFRIVGVQEQFHFKGVFVSQAAIRGLYSDTDTLVLLQLPQGTDADAYAERLEANYRDIGLNAVSIRSEVLKETEQFRQIFTLIQLFLGLGLVVGILSLGIVTARSIIERRQEIGMMRAMGLLRREVRRAFLLETITVVTLGIIIGAAVAILVSFGLWFAIVRELNIPYFVPWADLLVIALVAYAATILATLSPIFRASRIPPADALRYIE